MIRALGIVLLLTTSVTARAQDDHAGHASGHTDHVAHDPLPADAITEAVADADTATGINSEDRAAMPPQAPIPEPTAEDRKAAFPDVSTHAAHGDGIAWMFKIDRLEARDAGGAAAWDVQAWIGTDVDRLWLRSHGEREEGDTHAAEIELLYGRSISPWWDIVTGLRHENRPAPSRDSFAIGLQGLAPYKFEVATTAWVGSGGMVSLRAEAEYDLLLTNRLILQPALEVEAHDRRDPARGRGAGLASLEAGLRLRYEITRRFAPYLGVEHERSFGTTRRLRLDQGEHPSDTRVVGGLHLWF